MIERRSQSGGGLFHKSEDVCRSVHVQDRRDVRPFADPPLRDTDGLAVVDEDLSRSSPSEADHSMRRVTFEGAFMHDDLGRDERPQHVAPPPTGSHRHLVHIW